MGITKNVGMPKPDVALKDFFKDNEVFAGVFNSYLYDGEEVIRAAELESDNTAYSEVVSVSGKKERLNKYRDIVRRTSVGYLVIVAIENQDKVHYAMPLRKMLYDVLGYSAEVATIVPTKDKRQWTVDERLSKVEKGTKITPIITVVFYTGETPWDGPHSLHEMMDMDENVKKYVPDYPLYVIDVGHDETLDFKNESLRMLHSMLSSVYGRTGERNMTEVNESIIALTGILAGDEQLYRMASEAKGGKRTVCRALEERDEKIRAEYESRIAEKDASIAEKDAEIAALKEQLAFYRVSWNVKPEQPDDSNI